MRPPKTENENSEPLILETRRQVMSAVINALPQGREGAAQALGLDLKRFDNQVYENNGHRPLNDAQVRQLERLSGTHFLADYICRLYGGVFVPMPEATDLDNMDLYQRALMTDVAEGRVDQAISRALANGEIDEGELAEIIAKHRIHIAARHAEVGAVITLHRRARP
ncbi:YmfL family putative regulatory protein [Metapseudomonas otitidis]|uniref:YmfL family putative regulatory protein n=1 Tax=Metapseudomonas otitidis TaxID=319939 RepID=UPI0013F60B4E|nr:YmfL family putative regulatory protein [Pseudomonas otitidis]